MANAKGRTDKVKSIELDGRPLQAAFGRDPEPLPDVNSIQWWHRIQLPDGTFTPGEVRHGEDGGDWPTTRFGMPLDLTGKRVLDVGAWDGFFSFEAEKRGASEVLAIDEPDPRHYSSEWEGFSYAKRALGSNVERTDADVQNLREDLGEYALFDLVLCYGVLYHIDNPVGALREIFKVLVRGGVALIETAIHNDAVPAWFVKHGNDNDETNLLYPTISGLIATLRAVGFTSAEVIFTLGGDSRCTVKAVK